MPTSTDNLAAARTRIAAAYDPNALEAAGKKLIAILADHFRRVEGRDAKVLNWAPPQRLISEARHAMDCGEAAFPGISLPNSAAGNQADAIANRLAQLASETLARGQN